MLRIWILLIIIFSSLGSYAQVDTTRREKQTSAPATLKQAAVPQVSKGKTDSSHRNPPRQQIQGPEVRSQARQQTGITKLSYNKDKDTDRVDSPLVAQRPAYLVLLDSLEAHNRYFIHSKETALNDINRLRQDQQDDWLVYVIAGVLLILGIFRVSYIKFFSDLFRAFFNPTLSQRQLKDQLSQSPFPNFLLNIFFVISLGLYLYLLMNRLDYVKNEIKWMLIPGLMLLVALIYFIKYVVLRFSGWLFGSMELTDSYIFILYLINKVLGVILVPFLVVLAFCNPDLAKVGIYISLFLIVLLVGYRYVRSYSLVKQYLSFSKLHFFLYLCTFEVMPVLIIIKVLLKIVNG